MNNSYSYDYIRFLLVGLLILFFFGDLIKIVYKLLDLDYFNFPKYSKVLGGFFVVIYILKFKLYRNKKVKALIYCILVLTLVFLLNNLILKNVNFIDNIKANHNFFLKACVLPFLLIPFHKLDNETTQRGILIIKYIFWINCIFILVGFFFDVDSFQTYSRRFGYKGVFDRSTYTSYMFIFMIMFHYYNWICKNQKSELKYLLIVICVSCLVGTKRIYFFNGLLFIFHFFYNKLYKKKLTLIVSLLLVTVIVIFKKAIISVTDSLFNFSLWVSVYEERGFLSVLTSLRSDLLMEYINVHILEKWSHLNYLLGGGFFHQTRPEIALIDVYLFFGLIGVFIYVYMFKRFIINFKSSNKVLWFYLVMVILLALTSSGIIFSAYFALIIILFSSYFRIENEKIIR